jgi:hypothetical protein
LYPIDFLDLVDGDAAEQFHLHPARQVLAPLFHFTLIRRSNSWSGTAFVRPSPERQVEHPDPVLAM